MENLIFFFSIFLQNKGEYSPNQGIINNGAGFNTLSTGYQSFKQQQHSGFNGFNSVNGINPSGSSYGSGTKPIFESVSNYDGSGPGASGFGTSGFGNLNSLGNGGSFHSTNPDYYKKALKGSSSINSLNSYGGSSSSYGGLYSNGGNYHESARQDNFDCVCVPYDQCPARDVLGRKGDLILPLDPRNLGTDIEAEDSNSTASNSTRVAKQISNDNESNVEDDENGKSVEIETTQEDVKKISKREVAEKKADELQKSDGEAVSIQNDFSFFSILCLICGRIHFISFSFSNA